MSKTGGNPSFGEAFVRNISKIYWLLRLLAVIVGLAITKGYKQKYSDHLMGTTVSRPLATILQPHLHTWNRNSLGRSSTEQGDSGHLSG